MDLERALTLFGLDASASVADLEARYRALRKPLLKRLNRSEPGQEPPELVGQLDAVEAGYKVLRPALAVQAASGPAKAPAQPGRRSTGRVTLETGAVLLGRYEIQGLLTHRPEGDTYRVFDRIRQSEVALKLIDEALLRGTGRRALLHRGLLDASRLNHPHLARVLDIHPMQHTYAVTQALPRGQSLWDRLYGQRPEAPALAPDALVRAARGATRALAYAHALMPHATLRPESLWVDEDGHAQVADLGLVDLQGPLRAKRLSRAKLGTAYWAPEQFKDDEGGAEPSDQYALALMCYEAIIGEPASGRIGRIRDEAKAYPPAFKRALERALSSRPARRFPDMDAFGEAAFRGYRRAGKRPAALSLPARVVPALLLLLAFAGFALSGLGQRAAAAIGARAEAWDTTMARDAADDLELRRLRALAARLGDAESRLDEASRAELERVRAMLWTGRPDAAERAACRRDLTQVVRQVVGTSRHRAEKARERAYASLDELRVSRTQLARRAAEAIGEARTRLTSAPVDARPALAAIFVRMHALRARRLAQLDAELDALTGAPDFASGLRAMEAAEHALAIGDDAAAGRAYERAVTAFGAITDGAETVATGLEPWSTPTEAPEPEVVLDARASAETLDAFLQRPEQLADDPELVNVLATQRQEAMARARVRWRVSEEGWFTLTLETTTRQSMLAGTWQETGAVRTLRTAYWDGRLLEPAYETPAERGAAQPGLADLRSALARVPQGPRAQWSVVRSGTRALPIPSFEQGERVVRSGEVALRADVPDDARVGVVTARRRYEPDAGRVKASARVSGDVLRTWIRAHAVSGLRSGPAGWQALRVDGLKPRVQLLEPRPDTTLEPGQEVVLRFFAYDSNLRALEVQGEAAPLRRDDVYVLIEQTLRAPETGALKLPVRAVDAAGNETQVEWTFPVR